MTENTAAIAYCPECRRKTDYVTLQEKRQNSIDGRTYTYIRKVARCLKCNEELDVYNDENLEIFYRVYREDNNIVSLEHVREIPKMYNIGVRVLSVLLGWGENTLTRYYKGSIPTKQYSDVLKRLYRSPVYYKEILEENKSVLTEIAYKKTRRALDGLLCVNHSSIMSVASNLLQKKEDMTALRLQKLLYYIQGVSLAFCAEPAFTDECEAWVNGPVYREVYYAYSIGAIADIPHEDLLSPECVRIIDSVLKCFGHYDGDTLRDFTHEETPWLKARGNLSRAEPSREHILLKDIKEFFIEIKAKYGMSSPDDMRKYAEDMFAKVGCWN